MSWGRAENAVPENAGPIMSSFKDRKCSTGKSGTQTAGPKNAGPKMH